MTGVNEDLGSAVVAVSFWAAVAMLGVSGLLALSKVSWNRIVHPQPTGGGARILILGFVTAFLILAAPRLTAMGSDLAGGAVGGGVGGAKRPGVMEYFATLSSDGLWIAGVVVAVWVVAVVATVAVGLSRLGSTAE